MVSGVNKSGERGTMAEMLTSTLSALLLRIAAGTPLRHLLLPQYKFQFGPKQLLTLCDLLADTSRIHGSVAEIGCAQGYTTMFLCHYLHDIDCPKRYFVIDTFSGFRRADVSYEVINRGKSEDMYRAYRFNSRAWFDAIMREANISRVTSICADASTFDYSSLGPLAFALLDVDLYMPTATVLPVLFRALQPGGVVVVDDCDPTKTFWDGAYEAYTRFATAERLPITIAAGKLGILRKAGD
jgi:O-methyltransferase